MSYLIDRQRALMVQEIVAVVQGLQRRERSRVILRDNSLYRTLTRPKVFRAAANRYPESLFVPATAKRRKEGRWRKQQ